MRAVATLLRTFVGERPRLEASRWLNDQQLRCWIDGSRFSLTSQQPSARPRVGKNMLLVDLSVRKECDAFRQKQLFFCAGELRRNPFPEASEASACRHDPVARYIVVRAKTHRLPNGSRGAAIDGACDHGIAGDFAGRKCAALSRKRVLGSRSVVSVSSPSLRRVIQTLCGEQYANS